MPSLLVSIVNDRWAVQVANTDISYNFIGATLDAQEPYIIGFAESMAQGVGDVADCLEGVEITGAELAQQLYGTTDILMYSAKIIYGTVGEEFLIDDLEAAGEALWLVIA